MIQITENVYDGANCPNCGMVPPQSQSWGTPRYVDPLTIHVESSCSGCGEEYVEEYRLDHAGFIRWDNEVIIHPGEAALTHRSSEERLLYLAETLHEELTELADQSRLASESFRHSPRTQRLMAFLSGAEEDIIELRKRVRKELD